jgi:hypothetical protein
VNVLFAARAGTLDVPRRSGWPRRPSPPPTPRTGHGSSGHRLREPILVQGALPACWCIGTPRSSANRNNGCSRGRPLRQADHRIQIALKSAPRAMGKTLVSAPSARIRLGRLATAVPNARRATCSASRRTEYDQLSMATGKAIGTAARLQYDLATRVTTSHHDDS